MKVFEIMPTTGLSDEEFKNLQRKNQYEYMPLIIAEFELSPAEIDVIESDRQISKLKQMINIMLEIEKADICIFCHGWEHDKICRIINEMCKTFKIRIVDLDSNSI